MQYVAVFFCVVGVVVTAWGIIVAVVKVYDWVNDISRKVKYIDDQYASKYDVHSLDRGKVSYSEWDMKIPELYNRIQALEKCMMDIANGNQKKPTSSKGS